jgi:hypothetical protein
MLLHPSILSVQSRGSYLLPFSRQADRSSVVHTTLRSRGFVEKAIAGLSTTRQEPNWEALILKIFSKTFSDIQQNRKVGHDGIDKKPLLGE